MKAGAASATALVAATLAAYWALIARGFVLIGFDALVFFYPLMGYRDRRLRAGELPLWAPDYFLGAPFLANPQTGVLYPPNLLTVFLDPPRAYAWQAFGHSLLLALASGWLARRALGASALGGVVAGLIAALGGCGLALVGHLNQLQAAAWLPLALLLGDAALARRSLRPVAGLGVVLALQFLAGHAQQSYMSIATLAVWLLARALFLARPDDRAGSQTRGTVLSVPTVLSVRRPLKGAWLPTLLWPLLTLAAAGLISILLAAPQLLPTQEATSQGIRAGGMTYREVVAFSLPPWMLPLGLLPVFSAADQPGSEWQGYVGLTGLLLASVGALAGRPRREARLLALVALGAFLLALGQFGPLYPLLYRVVPGLGLFRVPARWLFVCSFALAMLAALGLDALRAQGGPAGAKGPSGRCPDRRLVGRALGLLALVALALVVYGRAVPDYPLRLPAGGVLAAWAGLAAAAALLALAAVGGPGRRLAPAGLVLLLAGELLAASWPLDINRAGPPEAYTAQRPTEAHLLAQLAGAGPGPHRTLAITDAGFDPGDLELLRSQVAGLLSPERVEDWVAAVKHKDAMTPNLPLAFGLPSIDGYDGGVLPLRSYVGIKELFPLRAANLADGRLGIQLERLPPVELLSWLGVGWVVMDRHRDVWVDGVYYDLAVQSAIAPGGSLTLAGVSPNARASGLGVIAWPAEGPTAGSDPALEVELAGADGAVRRAVVPGDALLPLSLPGPQAGSPPRSGSQRESGRVPVRLRLDGPAAPVARVTVRVPAGGARIVLGGLTLIDEATGGDWPVPAAPGLRYSALGDVKVYRNELARPRALLVHGASPAGDDAEARGQLRDGLDPFAAVAVVDLPDGWPRAAGPAEPGESVEVVSYAPERVELRARLARAGVVLLTDAAYPGWEATANGRPVPIRRADGGLRALLLEPGDYRISLVYRPLSVLLGAGLALLGLALTALLLAAPGWLRGRAGSASMGPTEEERT